jgi:hypothetical protein
VLCNAGFFPVKYPSGLPVGYELLFWSTTTLLQVALFIQSFFGEGIDILIDNRVINMPGLMSLEQMVQMVPYANHPMLRWIVVVKPEQLVLETETLPVEEHEEKRLKNVESLAVAIGFLQETEPELDWQSAERHFFPNSDIVDLLKTK